jgi:YfiH family protein
MNLFVDKDLVKKTSGEILVAFRVEGGNFSAFVAFTSRRGGFSSAPYASLNLSPYVGDDPRLVAKNRQLIASFFGFADFYTLNQVHGSELVILDEDFVKKNLPEHLNIEADGFIVKALDAPAAVLTADCLPVVMVAENGIAAVIHAGWRGLKKGILDSALKTLLKKGCGKIVAFFGPSICRYCYEIGEDVIGAFEKEYPEAILDLAKSEKNYEKTLEKKKSLDLKFLGFKIFQKIGGEKFRYLRLNEIPQTGMPGCEHVIVDVDFCTFEEHFLYSCRRERQTGRQAALVYLKNRGR